jgi:hypothetical protein
MGIATSDAIPPVTTGVSPLAKIVDGFALSASTTIAVRAIADLDLTDDARSILTAVAVNPTPTTISYWR